MSNNDNKTPQNGASKFKLRMSKIFERFRRNGNILYELTRKSVKTQYRGSVLGMFWTVLNPLLNMGVMWLVFSQFFGRDDPAYPVYLLTGNILFASLRAATNGALGSVVANRGLLLRTKISPHLFPMSSVMSALVSFGFSFIALIVIMLVMQLGKGLALFGVQMLLVLAMQPAFLLFETGIGLALAAIYVYGRDIRHFYGVFLTLWTYLTPIFYKVHALEGNSFVLKVVECNPMYYFVQYFRDAVYNLHYAEESMWKVPDFLQNVPSLVWLYIIGFVTCAVGIGLFTLLKKRFATHL